MLYYEHAIQLKVKLKTHFHSTIYIQNYWELMRGIDGILHFYGDKY